ncbi:MAG: ATP-binding cassette domain-containing protein, partial [Alphaproteobacteria bacterium]
TARRRRNLGRLRNLEALREARNRRDAIGAKVNLATGDGPPASQLVCELNDVHKHFLDASGERIEIVSNFSTRILRGDRVGIIGPNGAGKTTLLRMLLGEEPADRGRIKMGARTEIAYFDQARRDIDPKVTPWQYLCPQGGDQVNVHGRKRHVVGYLKDYLFDEDDSRSLIATLSGGQRNRLMLAKVLAQPSNLLVLDEPTNDLDMDTLDKLQDALAAYEGTLLVVSHDRDFLDKLTTSLIVLEGRGDVQEYVGGYQDYVRQRRPLSEPVTPRTAKKAHGAASAEESGRAPTKLSYKDARALDLLPEEIAALEREIAVLNERLGDAGLFSRDAAAFNTAAARLERARDELSVKEARWFELEALREKIEGARG